MAIILLMVAWATALIFGWVEWQAAAIYLPLSVMVALTTGDGGE